MWIFFPVVINDQLSCNLQLMYLEETGAFSVYANAYLGVYLKYKCVN